MDHLLDHNLNHAIHVVAATGLNILTGYTGLVSLGHAAFMGVGAYTAAIAEARLGTGALPNLFLGGAAAAAVGVVVGLPSLRVKGLYLAGGAAHPGPGMPMVMMSGWIAADALDRDLGGRGMGAEADEAGRRDALRQRTPRAGAPLAAQ